MEMPVWFIEEAIMLNRLTSTLVVLAIAGSFPAGATTSAAITAGQAGTPVAQSAQSTPQPQVQSNPRSQRVAAGEAEAKKLLLLMDQDKNGKVSKQEFMAFMEAEFDRLDKDKSGDLDVQELTQSQLRTRPGFTTPRR